MVTFGTALRIEGLCGFLHIRGLSHVKTRPEQIGGESRTHRHFPTKSNEYRTAA